MVISTFPYSPDTSVDRRWSRLLDIDDPARLDFGLDVGTRFTSVHYWIFDKDISSLPYNFEHQTIKFQNSHQLETMCAIVPSSDATLPRIMFGARLEDALNQRDVLPSEVLELIKLSLVPPQEPRFEKMQKMIGEIHDRHNRILASAQTGRVLSELNFEGIERPVVVTTMKDVFREFLRFLLDAIKEDIRAVSGLSRESIRYIFANKTRMAVAMPAIWTSDMIDILKGLFRNAGYLNVHIASEPKCAAAVLALKQRQSLAETSNMETRSRMTESISNTLSIVLDIGQGTADLTTCRIQQLEPTLKIQTVVMGSGSLAGAYKWTAIFKEHLQRILKHNWDVLLARIRSQESSNITSDELLDRFALGFERVKLNYDTKRDNFIIPCTGMRSDLPIIHGTNVIHSGVSLTRDQMQDIFEEYFDLICRDIDKQIKWTRDKNFPAHYVYKIEAVGGGSLNKYLLKRLQAHYGQQGISVTSQEQTTYSIVAKGALLSILDHDLSSRSFFRTSFGTIITLAYDENNVKHLQEDREEDDIDVGYVVHHRAEWVAKVGEQYDPARPPLLELDIDKQWDGKYPITLESLIIKSEHPELAAENGWDVRKYPIEIQKAGILHINIEEDDFDFPECEDSLGQPLLFIRLRVIIVFDGMDMKWQVIIPHSGTFPDPNDLYNHGDHKIVDVTLKGALQYQSHIVEDIEEPAASDVNSGVSAQEQKEEQKPDLEQTPQRGAAMATPKNGDKAQEGDTLPLLQTRSRRSLKRVDYGLLASGESRGPRKRTRRSGKGAKDGSGPA